MIGKTVISSFGLESQSGLLALSRGLLLPWLSLHSVQYLVMIVMEKYIAGESGRNVSTITVIGIDMDC